MVMQLKTSFVMLGRGIQKLCCLPARSFDKLLAAVTSLFSRSKLLFLKEFILHPRSVGSILPSSKKLSQQIADLVAQDKPGLIIELGAGTGTVTEALLKTGINPERFVIVERQPSMVACLRRQFPQLKVVQGDAQRLSQLIKQISQDKEVAAVISSLPLNSLPKKLRDKIVAEVRSLLSPQGQYIQYNYFGLDVFRRTYSDFFAREDSRLIWKNVPPARVSSYCLRPEAQVERVQKCNGINV